MSTQHNCRELQWIACAASSRLHHFYKSWVQVWAFWAPAWYVYMIPLVISFTKIEHLIVHLRVLQLVNIFLHIFVADAVKRMILSPYWQHNERGYLQTSSPKREGEHCYSYYFNITVQRVKQRNLPCCFALHFQTIESYLLRKDNRMILPCRLLCSATVAIIVNKARSCQVCLFTG